MATFIQGDYEYYIMQNGELAAEAIDKTKSSYEAIPPYINYNGKLYTVTYAHECFKDCTNLTSVGGLPHTLTLMRYCFKGCTSLVTAPQIPPNVVYVDYCFQGCTSLVTAPVIPSSVHYARLCFDGCTNLEGNVYISPSSDHFMEFTDIFTNTTKDIYVYFTGMADGSNISTHMFNPSDIFYLLLYSPNNVYFMCTPQEKITYDKSSIFTLNKDSVGETSSVAIHPETNAHLVQVDIPEKGHRGGSESSSDTITVTLYDALIDLMDRVDIS